MISNKKISLGAAFAFAAVVLTSIPNIWASIGKTITRQAAANERLIEWKSDYQALLPVNEVWNSSFVSPNKVRDLLLLYRVADIEQHGLHADVDSIQQTGVEPLLVEGMRVGLQKLCMASKGGSLEVTAASMSALRKGLHSLAERKDVDLGTVEIGFSNADGTPMAKIKPFCVRVRTDGVAAVGDV